jgi:glycosyltransferase involved in cell wall biosynthesis
MDDLISIGLPIVKTNFLVKSIECCLNQTYKNIEIIVQNNGPNQKVKNEVREILNKFQDNRIKYFENENQIPMIENWNMTLEKASGKFFTILCDDDIWHKDFIHEMYSLSLKYPKSNIFHSRVALIDASDNLIRLSEICPEHESSLDFIYGRINGSRTFFLSDFLLRKKELIEIGGYISSPDGWGSDDLTYFNLAKHGGVAYSDKVYFKYRVSEFNITNNKNIKNKLKAIDHIHKSITQIIKSYKNLSEYDILIIKMIQTKLLNYKIIRKSHLLKTYFMDKFKLPKYLSLFLSFFLIKIRNV